jgi:putative membrane protein
MKVEKLLNPDERTRISPAVAAAEARTAGEIVPMLVGKSDTYAGAHWRLAALTILIGGLAIYFFAPDWFHPLPTVFGLAICGELMGQLRPLLRLMITEKESKREVYERALHEFREHKISRTHERTGILILVSLFEHRVTLLADDGINAKVAPGTWDQLVNDFIGAIKKDRLADGFVEAVTRCGAILAEHLPVGTGDQNEIPNELIVKK